MDNTVINSAIPFPNIEWYHGIKDANNIIIDIGERYEKMSYRNRYYIGAANGMLALSIPIQKGRDQRAFMKDIKISYQEDWQSNHWKTIKSAYNRTPFFEYYEPYLLPLFEAKMDFLYDWNIQSIEICNQLLGLKKNVQVVEEYVTQVNGKDLRHLSPKQLSSFQSASYFQPFDTKHGFINNLSIIDLLCCEGNAALLKI